MAHADERLISLDVFRGMTIAGMVLVNSPGSWSHIYGPLRHAEWHGLTPTDWIFPFFLFIVGVAIPIALGRRSEQGVTGRIVRKIVLRAVMIFALGLAISVVPFFQFAATDAPDWLKMLVWLAMSAALFFLLLRKWIVAGALVGVSLAGIAAMYLAGYSIVGYDFGMMRIFGVLQRIAVCYLIVSIIFLYTNWKQQLGIAVSLLVGYWALMTLIPMPGCEVATIDDKACNLAAYLDRLILGENHIWRGGKVFDPEGILSTLPAIATTISGLLAGRWLMSVPPLVAGGALPLSSGKAPPATAGGTDRKAIALFFFGVVLLAAGYIWSYYLPLNKSLWTSSYVLVTSGLALLVLGSCYWLIDVKGYTRWTKPFVIFGVNALALFVFSGILGRMLGAYKVSDSAGQSVSVHKWIFDNLFSTVAHPTDASLMFAVSYIVFWLLLMWLLYRKRICIKV